MLISYSLNEFGFRHQLGHVLLPVCESIVRIYDVTACFQRQRSTEFLPREWPLRLNVHSLTASHLAKLVAFAHVRAIRLYPDLAGGREALPTPAGYARSRYPATPQRLPSHDY